MQWQHLRVCMECQNIYNRVMSINRILYAPTQNVTCASELEYALVGNQVAQRTLKKEEKLRPWLSWQWIGVTCALMLLLVVNIWYTKSSLPVHTIQMRDGQTPPLAVRIFCEFEDISGQTIFRSIALDSTTQEVTGCPTSGRLHFAYLSKSAGFAYALIDDRNGHLTWLKPNNKDNEPIIINPFRELQSMNLQVDLQMFSNSSIIQVIFVFSYDRIGEIQKKQLFDNTEAGEIEKLDLTGLVIQEISLTELE